MENTFKEIHNEDYLHELLMDRENLKQLYYENHYYKTE